MLSLSLRARLFALLLLGLGFVAFVGSIGLAAAASMARIAAEYREAKVPRLVALSRLATAIGRVTGAAAAIENGSLDEATHAAALATIADQVPEARAAAAALGASGGDTARLLAPMETWRRDLDDLAAAARRRRAAADAAKFAEEAGAQHEVTAASDRLRAGAQALLDALDGGAASTRAEAEALDARARGAERAARLWIAAAFLAAAAALSLAGLLLIRSIRRGLTGVVGVASRVAEGDLSAPEAATSEDELGALQGAMATMAGRLDAVIGDVRGGASALATAAGQVSATAHQLSSGTSAQAAGVEETNLALSDMRAVLVATAEGARETRAVAAGGNQAAEQGGRAVAETLEAMRAIAGRIGIVEEIAYQTNLLALNAAIEAARAGDRGRGFAVVAAEVRKLAERSQEAAKEIREVASRSVGVAERSGKLVEDLVQAMRRTAALVEDVAASADGQGAGVERVSRAMETVEQVAQRNAAAAEELSSTAEEVASHAAALEQLVAFFRTERAAPSPRLAEGDAPPVRAAARGALAP